jgi:hypothetical protein
LSLPSVAACKLAEACTSDWLLVCHAFPLLPSHLGAEHPMHYTLRLFDLLDQMCGRLVLVWEGWCCRCGRFDYRLPRDCRPGTEWVEHCPPVQNTDDVWSQSDAATDQNRYFNERHDSASASASRATTAHLSVACDLVDAPARVR